MRPRWRRPGSTWRSTRSRLRPARARRRCAPGRRDALWAAEQALRSGSCHALLGWLRRSSYDDLRRLAVAAEGSSAFVALFRPREAAAESSPACLRLALEPDGDAPESNMLS